MIHHGDCLDVMAAMPEASVDAVVCDPPYGIGFMSKSWDELATAPNEARWNKRGRNTSVATAAMRGEEGIENFRHSVTGAGFAEPNPRCALCGKVRQGTPKHVCQCGDDWVPAPRVNRQAQRSQEWHQRWATEAFRVAKPGAYLLAFGGTRTYHRLACAIEDAGWIIRDTLIWCYASGFPKSKANLKPAFEPIVMARKPGPLRELAIDACRIPTEGESFNTPQSDPRKRGGVVGTDLGISGSSVEDFQQAQRESIERTASLGRWPANVILTDPIFDGDVEGVVGGGADVRGATSNGKRLGNGYGEGYGEMEQTPSYGDTGTYSRFFLIPKASRSEREPVFGGLEERRKADDGPIIEFVHPPPSGIGTWLREQREAAGLQQKQVAAHFPSKTGGLTGCVANWELEFNRPTPDQWRTLREAIGFDDRYDEAMTTQREVTLDERTARSTSQNVELMREIEGLGKKRLNAHPTVKPLELMRHLVRLVTPTVVTLADGTTAAGTVLDPFLGSGTTAIAAEMEGFAWIGIEREAEYVAIAEARLQGVQRGLGLDVAAPTPRMPNTHPDLSKHQPKRRAPSENWSGAWAGTDEDVA